MWIFCCGANGSGSMLKFKIVSELVERCSAGKGMNWDSREDFSLLQERGKKISGFKVVHTHKLPSELDAIFQNNTAIGFYTYRDIRNVLISIAHVADQPIDQYLNDGRHIKEYINHYFEWQKISNIYKSAYEDFAFDPESEIRRIRNVLNLDSLSEEVIAEISKLHSLKKPNSSENKDQWKSVFNPVQNKIIEKNAGQWLFNNGYDLTTNVLDSKLYSYAQHGDDDYIWRYFNKKKKGLIVEVGAFDGIHFSNSYSLENIGWRSLCIEPTPAMFKKLTANRPKAECFNVAVVGDDDIREIDFLSEELGLLSGVNIDVEDVRSRYKRRGLKFKEPEKIKVKAKTLNSILGQLEIKAGEIDCITIDVEGFEMDVLRGIKLEIYTPQLIIIEANTPEHEKEITDYLSRNNYNLLTKLGVNLIFHPKNEHPRKIEIDCIPMVQHHPLGKEFTIQAITATREVDQKPNIIIRGFRKIKRIFQ